MLNCEGWLTDDWDHQLGRLVEIARREASTGVTGSTCAHGPSATYVDSVMLTLRRDPKPRLSDQHLTGSTVELCPPPSYRESIIIAKVMDAMFSCTEEDVS